VFRTGRDFSPQPSAFLADIVKGVSPGDALDVGMGQGRNALYLASQGWHVTGIDISDEGLRLARKAADARHLSLEAIRADAATWDYGVDRWDLVALIFFGPDDKMVARLRTAVRCGGLVVVEHFHKGAFADDPNRGYGNGELPALFADGFTVVRDEVVEDAGDWGGEPGTRRLLERFAARRR
jgi:SAM-dependent methyltransferase